MSLLDRDFGAVGQIRGHPDTPKPTFPAVRPIAAIDYAISSLGIATTTEVRHVPGSDHLPLLTVARLGGAGAASASLLD